MKRTILALFFTAAVSIGWHSPLSAQEATQWTELDTQDMRLATVAERIMIANAALCREQMPVTGMVLHSADQYPSGAVGRFANGPLAIALVLPASPAEAAGLSRDDAVTAIGGQAVRELPVPERSHLREEAFDLLASQSVESPVSLTVVRDGETREVAIAAPTGCRSLVEIRVGDGPRAQSNGQIIQVRFDFAQQASDEELAVIFAHELAHSVLEHRRRKEDADIAVGVAGELGRSQAANRQAEVEADRLSIHLLANAGFDPRIAPFFWRNGIGRGIGGGLIGSTIYPSTTARADLLEREVQLFLPIGRGPSWPDHLLIMRDRVFRAD